MSADAEWDALLAETPDEPARPAEAKRERQRKRRDPRKPLPDHLPLLEIVYEFLGRFDRTFASGRPVRGLMVELRELRYQIEDAIKEENA